MPPIGVPELLLILALVLVVFGPKRLKNLGSEIGNSIKGFRNAMKEQDSEDSQTTNESTADQSSEKEPPKQTHA